MKRARHLPHGGDVVSMAYFIPDDAEWATVEEALGGPLSDADRKTLGELADWYLFKCESERAAPPASAAEARIKKIRRHTKALMELLSPKIEPVDRRVRDALDDALNDPTRNEPSGYHEELGRAETVLRRLLMATTLASRRIDEEATTERPRESWNFLVWQLAEFCKPRGIKARARQDFGSRTNPDRRPSPFVVIVSAFQNLLPVEYRRGAHSVEALSKEVATALATRKTVLKAAAEGSL